MGLFLNWKYGLTGLSIEITGSLIANRFGKEFSVKTVGQVAEKMARENYVRSRRNPKTANRPEIILKLKELFSQELNLDPSVLTREATF